MNYKLSENNPLEMMRIGEKMSQDEFAFKLGFLNKAQYIHHMRNFTRMIIDKVKTVYSIDLTMEIINYLKCENRRISKLCKELSKQALKTTDNEEQHPVDSDWKA